MNIIMTEKVARTFLGRLFEKLVTGEPVKGALKTYLYRYRKVYKDYNLPELPDLRALRGEDNAIRRAMTVEVLKPYWDENQGIAPTQGEAEPAAEPGQAESEAKLEANGKAKTDAETEAEKKEAHKQEKLELQRQAERFKTFGKVFGATSKYRIMDSVIKVLCDLGFDLTNTHAVFSYADAYRDFRLKHPKLGLPLLPYRRNTADPIAENYSLLSARPDLAAFEFPYETINDYDGIVVTAAQFDCEMHQPLWKMLKEVWIPLREKLEGRRYALLVLPIVFGPVDLVYSAALDDFQLAGTFAKELKGHMVLRDLRFKENTLLKVIRMMPSLEGNFLTDGLLNTFQREPATTMLFAAPVVELVHRAQPGLVLGDSDPRAFLTTGTVTIPDYGRDNLGLASRRATISMFDTNFAFQVIDAMEGEGRPRDVIDQDRNGCVYDIVKYRGKPTVFKFEPQGAMLAENAVDTVQNPDWHTGYADKPIRDALIGEHGLIPTLSPLITLLDDFIDCTAVSSFLETDRLGRQMLKDLTFEELRDVYAYPADLDAYLARAGVWQAPMKNAAAELRFCGTEALHIARTAPNTTVVYVPSNHNDWLDQMVWEPKKWNDENMVFMAKLLVLMDKERRRATEKYGYMASAHLGAGASYLKQFIRDKGGKFGVEPDQFKFLTRLETFIRPLSAREQTELGRHGDKPRFRGKAQIAPSAGMRVSFNHFHVGEIRRNYRVVGVTGRRRHYMSESTTNWTHSTGVLFKNGQQMMLHPRQNGLWWAY